MKLLGCRMLIAGCCLAGLGAIVGAATESEPAPAPAPATAPAAPASPRDDKAAGANATPAPAQAEPCQEPKSNAGRPRRPPTREEWESWRQQWRALPPEEREARMQEFRERWSRSRAPGRLPPDQWQAKRKEFITRLEKKAETLRARQADGSISEADRKHLNRMEELLKRFRANAAIEPVAPARPADTPPPERHE